MKENTLSHWITGKKETNINPSRIRNISVSTQQKFHSKQLQWNLILYAQGEKISTLGICANWAWTIQIAIKEPESKNLCYQNYCCSLNRHKTAVKYYKRLDVYKNTCLINAFWLQTFHKSVNSLISHDLSIHNRTIAVRTHLGLNLSRVFLCWLR